MSAKAMNNLWLCIDCGWSCFGTHKEAHGHHHTNNERNWGHWIYEFKERFDGFSNYNEPTGTSIHTSDIGGYYFYEESPQMVAQVFMLKAANSASGSVMP